MFLPMSHNNYVTFVPNNHTQWYQNRSSVSDALSWGPFLPAQSSLFLSASMAGTIRHLSRFVDPSRLKSIRMVVDDRVNTRTGSCCSRSCSYGPTVGGRNPTLALRYRRARRASSLRRRSLVHTLLSGKWRSHNTRT